MKVETAANTIASLNGLGALRSIVVMMVGSVTVDEKCFLGVFINGFWNWGSKVSRPQNHIPCESMLCRCIQ